MIVKNRNQENTISYGQMNLIIHARNLWREFVVWGRIYLLSRIAGIGITQDAFKRLYFIPAEFGSLIKVIFGDEVAEKITQQLSSTVILYINLVDAMIAGNMDSVNELAKELYQNADDRAAYMASINPYWDETQWKNLIYAFYKYSFDEITSVLTNDPKNIDVFDSFLKHADTMGDYLAQGLFNYMTSPPQSKTP